MTGARSADGVLGSFADDARPMQDRDQHSYQDVLRAQLVENAEQLASADVGTLNLKIATTAVSELHGAFRMFGPYRSRRKVTIFGSARVKSEDVLYESARSLAESLAERGWMTVTGAGPGIMKAGTEGAGNENAIGVTIQLPFESSEGAALIDAERVAAMKYFFTRKLMLCKESHAFVSLPGGYGTQDETFELLTLVQTGKSSPVPLVLLDAPGKRYWADWVEWVDKHLVEDGFIDEADVSLFYRTDDVADAIAYIENFYRVYDSSRWSGDRLIVRLKKALTEADLAGLNERFSHILTSGAIEACEPTRGERLEAEKLDMPRVSLRLNRKLNGDLYQFIEALNAL